MITVINEGKLFRFFALPPSSLPGYLQVVIQFDFEWSVNRYALLLWASCIYSDSYARGNCGHSLITTALGTKAGVEMVRTGLDSGLCKRHQLQPRAPSRPLHDTAGGDPKSQCFVFIIQFTHSCTWTCTANVDHEENLPSVLHLSDPPDFSGTSDCGEVSVHTYFVSALSVRTLNERRMLSFQKGRFRLVCQTLWCVTIVHLPPTPENLIVESPRLL